MDEFTDVRHVKLKCLGGWPQLDLKLGRYFNYTLCSWIYIPICNQLQPQN